MHKFVFHNDRVLPLREVRLSPGQAGLLNGWGVFSTLRIYDGVPFEFDRHWERLMRDAERLDLPVPYKKDDVRRQLGELLKANDLSNGCARIYFVYNKIGVWCSDEPMPVTDFLMYTVDLPSRVGPTKIAVMENGRFSAHPLEGTKVTSWLQNVWVVERAHKRGFDDCLLLNEHGNVTECTAANVYMVKGGTLITPPLSAGGLGGVSRLVILETARQAGIPTVERDFKLEELYQSDEIFISSTTRQVQAISQIEAQKFAAPGPLTQKLAKLFDEYVERHTKHAVMSESSRV